MTKRLETKFAITNPTFTYWVNIGEKYRLRVQARDERNFINGWFSVMLAITDSDNQVVEDVTKILRNTRLKSERYGPIEIDDTTGRLYLPSLCVGDYLFSADFLEEGEA